MADDDAVDRDQVLHAEAEDAGVRLDRFIAGRLPEISRALVQRLIGDGHVRVNGRPSKPGYRLRAGETVRVMLPVPESAEARGENIPLRIEYEDDHVLVVDKPAGLVVHPAAGHSGGTLVNAVLWHAPEIVVGNAERPGIVHRLDRDTSGLIVIAKTDAAMADLQRQFASREVHKVYLALVEGRVAVNAGKIDAPIGRDPADRKKMAVVSSREGRASVTVFHVVERLEHHTLLKVEPQTGRTHQIRVHLAFIHHPVAGDPVYGASKNSRLGLERQFLHAWRLSFLHPATGQEMEFTAPLPRDLADALVQTGGDPAPWM